MPKLISEGRSILISKELAILIHIIRSVLLEFADEGHFSTVIQSEKEYSTGVDPLSGYDTARFNHLAAFHKVRPIVSLYDAKHPFLDQATRRRFALFRQMQARRTLSTIVEAKRILGRLSSKDITVLPFKGALMLQNHYGNRQLRESTDIDLLVAKDDVLTIVSMLVEDGYKVRDIEKKGGERSSDEKLLKHLMTSSYYNEITLIKDNVALDIHWELGRDIYQLSYTVEDVFSRSVISDFYNHSFRVPSDTDQFLLMLQHNGVKEHWLVLKNLIDLFFSNSQMKQDLESQAFTKILAKHNLTDTFNKGVQLLWTYFGIRFETAESSKLHSHVHSKAKSFNYAHLVKKGWERGEDWVGMKGSKKAFLHYLRLMLFYSSKSFSKKLFFKNLYRAYSVPNEYETRRTYAYKGNSSFLNVMSKLVSYILVKRE